MGGSAAGWTCIWPIWMDHVLETVEAWAGVRAELCEETAMLSAQIQLGLVDLWWNAPEEWIGSAVVDVVTDQFGMICFECSFVGGVVREVVSVQW